jgi:hypothetical protein
MATLSDAPLELLISNFLAPAPLGARTSLTTLATLSQINKEWESKILKLMAADLGAAAEDAGEAGDRTLIPRVVSWFEPSGIKTTVINVPGGKGRPVPVPCCERWEGVGTLRESLTIFGFSSTFCAQLSALLVSSSSAGVLSGGTGIGDGSGMVVGSTAARPDSPSTAPVMSYNEATGLACVSFLTATGDAATRLRTDIFPSGPIAQPVTVFMVGVALEDGCFLSGIKSRFEVGCMYPTTQIERLMDKSPIKMSASTQSLRGGVEKLNVEDGDDTTSSDEDDDDKSSNASVSSLPPICDVVAGVTGPGRWHLYTAVFDGENSVIRVDGVDETTSVEGNGVGTGSLDGLTLGGDHRFDISLCDGGGGLCGDGDGDGALSEVAVFQGRLAVPDIERMEEYLLKKHGLERGSKAKQDDDRDRLYAHALIHQPQPWKLVQRIPLRIAAAERSVSWEKYDNVTGEKLFVTRIGTNKSGSSSEW